MKARAVCAGFAAAFVAASAAGAGMTSQWTGAGNGCWTNAANWTAGVPGQYVAPDGSAAGYEGCTAVFSSVAQGSATTIDLDGLAGIRNITITGADAPLYTFGTKSAQNLPMEGWGGKFLIDESVANPPVFKGTLGLGLNVETGMDVYIENNSANPLSLSNFGYFTKSVTGTPTVNLHFSGAGTVRLAGSAKEFSGTTVSYKFVLDGTGDLEINTSSLSSLTRLMYIDVPDHGDRTNTVRIAKDCKILVNTPSAEGIHAAGNLLFAGEGTLELRGGYYIGSGQSGVLDYQMHSTGVFVESGRTVEFASALGGRAASNISGARCGLVALGSGKIVLSGSNALPGRVDAVGDAVTLEVPSVGGKGEPCALGSGDAIRLSGNSALVFTGNGGSTDRELQFSGKNGARAVLEHAGSGTLEFSSAVTQLVSGFTLDLRNATAYDAVFSGNLVDNPHPMNVVKSGSGRWILSGANTYSGTTSLNAGTLRLASGGSLASVVRFADGTRFEAEAGMEGGLSLSAPASGVAKLAVEGAGTVTVAALAGGPGVLDVELGEGASVKFAGVSAGSAPSYLTLGGNPAVFDEEGRLAVRNTSVTDEIPARGGVIPDGAQKTVGITAAGDSGPITLAGGANVTVGALKQMSLTDATVSLAGDLKLSLAQLSIGENAANLTVGSQPGEGTIALSSGSVLELGNESADSVLQINAALSVPAGASLAKLGAGLVRTASIFDCAGDLSLVDGVLAISNGAAPSAAISGAGTLRKEGDTSWTLSSVQENFSGDFVLAGGYNFMTANGVFGNDTGRLIVTNGATLDLSSEFAGNSGAVSFAGKEVVISGDGFEGLGALRYGRIGDKDDSSGAASAALDRLTLAGDASICFTNMSGGMGVSGTAAKPAVFDMNGHTLVKRGRGSFRFDNGSVANPGNIRVESDELNQQSSIRLGAFDLGGDASVSLVLGDTSSLVGNMFPPQKRTLAVEGTGARITFSSASKNLSTNFCNWAGPVTLANDLGVELRTGASDLSYLLTFSGPVSGSAGINVSAKSRLLLDGESNSFGGKLVLNGRNGATLAARAPGSIPDVSKVEVNGGRLAVFAPYWSAADISELAAAASFKDDNVDSSYLAVNTSHCENEEWTIAPGDTLSASGISHEGPGSLTVTGPVADEPRYACFGGALKFSGVQPIRLGAGKLRRDPSETGDPEVVFEDAADVKADVLTIGCTLNDTIGKEHARGKVTVRNSRLGRLEFEDSGSVSAGIRVGHSGTGILQIEGNSVVTNLLTAGIEPGACGAVYLRGGEFCNWSTGSSSSDIGAKGSAYVEVSGGKMVCGHGIAGLARQSSALCVMNVCGGTVDNAGIGATQTEPRPFYVARSGRAHLRVAGGRFHSDVTMFVCENNSALSGARGIVTVEGSGEFRCEQIFNMGQQDHSASILNLNGGSFAVQCVRGHPANEGSVSFVNADGGAMELVSDSVSLFRDVTRVTVFGGGLAVDTRGFDGTIDVPLSAPSGNGVVSIPPGWWGETEYVGAPYVEIIGSGTGASAYADFDAENRTVAAIHVTSPGCGYGDGTKAVLHWGELALTNAVATGVVQGGGLTKRGEGTLTLAATNTYAGTTVVEGGVLKLGCDWAVPSNGLVKVASGAVLDINGMAFCPRAISGAGTVSGSVAMPEDWHLDMADIIAGRHMSFAGEVSFPSGAKIVISNSHVADPDVRSYVLAEIGSLSGELPEIVADDPGLAKRRLFYSRGELKLLAVRGMAISFR